MLVIDTSGSMNASGMATVRTAVEGLPRRGAGRREGRRRLLRDHLGCRRRAHHRPGQGAAGRQRPEVQGRDCALRRRPGCRCGARHRGRAQHRPAQRRRRHRRCTGGGAAGARKGRRAAVDALLKAKVRAEVVAFKSPEANGEVLRAVRQGGRRLGGGGREPRRRRRGVRRRRRDAPVPGSRVMGPAGRPRRGPGDHRAGRGGRRHVSRSLHGEPAPPWRRSAHRPRLRGCRAGGRQQRFRRDSVDRAPAHRADRPLPRRLRPGHGHLRAGLPLQAEEARGHHRPLRPGVAAARPKQQATPSDQCAARADGRQDGGARVDDQDDGPPRPRRPRPGGREWFVLRIAAVIVASRWATSSSRPGHGSWGSPSGSPSGCCCPPSRYGTWLGGGHAPSSSCFPTSSCSSRRASPAGSACSRRSTRSPATHPSRPGRSSPARSRRHGSEPTSPTPWTTWPSAWTGEHALGDDGDPHPAEVGGNLAETLRTTAATLREREGLRRHVRALSAEGRFSAYILIALPDRHPDLDHDHELRLRQPPVDNAAGDPHVRCRTGRHGHRHLLDAQSCRSRCDHAPVVGVLLFVVAVVVVVLAAPLGAGQTTGVARSLELVNYRSTRDTVAKNELCEDRLLDPLLNALRGLAVRLSPAGTRRAHRALAGQGGQPAVVVR